MRVSAKSGQETRERSGGGLEKRADAVTRGASNPGRLSGTANAPERAWGARLASTTGVALPQSVSGPLQQRTGKSLVGVSVHSNPAASRMVKKRGAKAATIGRHIGVRSEHYRPGTPQGDRLLTHEAAHVLQQEGQARGIQHDDDAVLQAWLGHPIPLLAYTELHRVLSADDWTALNAAAHQRIRNALAGATLADPEGVRMVRELTLPVSLLFKPTTTPTHRTSWASDAFSLAYGQARRGQDMDQQALAEMMEEDELRRWIDANSAIMGGELTVSLIDPFGEAKVPSKLLFSFGEHPIPTLDGALYAGMLDHAGSASLPAIRAQTLVDAQALSAALTVAIPAYRAKEAGNAVLQTEHYRLARQAIVAAYTASAQSHRGLQGLSSPYSGLVSGLTAELSTQVQDIRTFHEQDTVWRTQNPRPSTETERHRGTQRVLTQHLYGGGPAVGLMPVTTSIFSHLAHRGSNALRGGQYDLEQGAAETYDDGQISMATYDEFVAAVQARGDAMIYTTGAIAVLAIGVGFLIPPLGIAGSALVFGTMGAVEAVVPMMVGDAMVVMTDLDDPTANAMWKGVRFEAQDYAFAATVGFGIGSVLGGGGAAFRAWRVGPAMVHAAQQGIELPVVPGARTSVVGAGRIRVEVSGQLGHMEFTSGGWKIWGPTGEAGTMRVLDAGDWARNLAGAPDDLLAGTLHQQPFGVGVGPRGWGVATPEGMQHVGAWGVDVWPGAGSARWAPSGAPGPVANPGAGPLLLTEGGPGAAPGVGATGPVPWPLPNMHPAGPEIAHLLWQAPQAWTPSPVLNSLPPHQLPLIGAPSNPGRWVHSASGGVEPRFLFGAPNGAQIATVPSGSGPMIIMDVPGISRSALVHPSASASGPARAYAPGMRTNSMVGIRSHLIPLRDGTYASTRMPGNYVDHLSSTYNSRFRGSLERRFRTAGHDWHALNVMDSTPRYGPQGHPIPQAEIILEMTPSGPQGWRFPNDLSYPNATAVPNFDDALLPYALSPAEVSDLLRRMGL